MFNVFKGLVGSKTLTQEDIKPVLNKMKDHLIGKGMGMAIQVDQWSTGLTYPVY